MGRLSQWIEWEGGIHLALVFVGIYLLVLLFYYKVCIKSNLHFKLPSQLAVFPMAYGRLRNMNMGGGQRNLLCEGAEYLSMKH